MKQDLEKARNLLSSGMDQVKQLKRMVSETKQSLQDQKRLQYLENFYREKIEKDEEAISYVDKKRRLQSAYRPGLKGIIAPQLTNKQSVLSIGGSYADQIAQKYKDQRGMSAHNVRRPMISSSSAAEKHPQLQRRKTAQPNQRQKMFEKIRSVKQKEEEKLRRTFMNFYKEDNKQDDAP